MSGHLRIRWGTDGALLLPMSRYLRSSIRQQYRLYRRAGRRRFDAREDATRSAMYFVVIEHPDTIAIRSSGRVPHPVVAAARKLTQAVET